MNIEKKLINAGFYKAGKNNGDIIFTKQDIFVRLKNGKLKGVGVWHDEDAKSKEIENKIKKAYKNVRNIIYPKLTNV